MGVHNCAVNIKHTFCEIYFFTSLKMKNISIFIFLLCIYLVKCQDVSEAITCDEFEVTEATDTSFDGVYEVSPLDVLGASEDEPVYEKKNGGGKFLFRKDGVWNLGSRLHPCEIRMES